MIRQLVLGELSTNCYVVQDASGKAIVIDPADRVDIIRSILREEQLTVTAVILTHAHFDHMLAAAALCESTGALLYVGAGDEPALSDPQLNLSGLFTPGQPISLQADRLLYEGDTVSVGDRSYTVWETPGHTPGCICLVGEDEVFSGDVLFSGSIGRTDFPGGDVPAMMASLRRLTTLPTEMAVYSGHGPATTIGQEMKTNPFLR